MIHQIWYDETSKLGLDKAFTPYDNTNPIRDKEFEYGVMRDVYLNNKLFTNTSKLGGVMSWKFNQKTGVQGSDFIKWIKRNPGYDVYFVNPWPELSIIYYNVWHQGEYFHPGITELTRKLTPLNLEQRHTFRELCYCNFWVANQKFWDYYMSHTEPMYERIINSPELKAIMFDIKADHSINAGMFAFIMERMFSTILAGSKFKVAYYSDLGTAKHKNEYIRQLIDKYYPIIKKIDKENNWTEENIKLINSIGAKYHDPIFKKDIPLDGYLCDRL